MRSHQGFSRVSGSREAGGLGSWLRCTRAPEVVPGHATAVTESTRFAGPALALRPWRVTRRRRRRGGCPWPEGSFRPSAARQRRTRSARHARKRLPRRTRARRARWNQGVGIVAVVVGGSVRAALKPECGLPSCGPIRRPARALRPKRPPACSLAAFEPSLHFVDVVHALDDDAAGRGG